MAEWQATSPDEPEPLVNAQDVARAIRNTGIFDEHGEETVARIAQRSGITARTIQRVLQREAKPLKLDIADRLLVAAGAHLADCRVIWE